VLVSGPDSNTKQNRLMTMPAVMLTPMLTSSCNRPI